MSRAAAITPEQDSKVQTLLNIVKELTGQGHRPVVFCRYISTAKYVGEYLDKKLRNWTVGVITGEDGGEERKKKVD